MLVVELVGLEPTTRVLWNVGVSDQLTLSDTKHWSSKRPAIDGHFHKSGNLRCARLGGGAGRTRTNHQSVMEHGWCPTNSPGRTPIQIAGRFAVLLDFPGFLILAPTTKVLW